MFLCLEIVSATGKQLNIFIHSAITSSDLAFSPSPFFLLPRLQPLEPGDDDFVMMLDYGLPLQYPISWLSGNAFDSINEVTLHWAGLVLGWAIACGQVNHLGM